MVPQFRATTPVSVEHVELCQEMSRLFFLKYMYVFLSNSTDGHTLTFLGAMRQDQSKGMLGRFGYLAGKMFIHFQVLSDVARENKEETLPEAKRLERCALNLMSKKRKIIAGRVKKYSRAKR